MSHTDVVPAIHAAVEAERENIITFLRELCAIPSMDSLIGPVGERVQTEMKKLGFDEMLVRQHGQHRGQHRQRPDKILLYDSHIDTVGIGNPDEWEWDPFIGKIEDGRFYARGACDEKGSTPPA